MQTALYETHKKLGAKIVSFAGYDMPLFYKTGINTEHKIVREEAGIFDVSHMGQILLTGSNIEEFLSYITPTDFSNTALNKAKYTVLLNEEGCPIDDLIIYKLAAEKFLLILNASRKKEDIDWIKAKLANKSIELTQLENRSLLALQGPQSLGLIKKLLPNLEPKQDYMTISSLSFSGSDIFLARTGYTGEDGFEVSIENSKANDFWQEALAAGFKPIGLGARDSLRLEAGYPLYGHELSEKINLSNATLNWIITSKENFIGKANLLANPTHKRCGILLIDKGVLRDGMKIFHNDNEIGYISSGAFLGTSKKSIAQAYINKDNAKLDSEVEVEVRGTLRKARISKLNFLKQNL